MLKPTVHFLRRKEKYNYRTGNKNITTSHNQLGMIRKPGNGCTKKEFNTYKLEKVCMFS